MSDIPRGQRLVMGYAGAEWLERRNGIEQSPLGTTVADALGYAYKGIYHLPSASLKRARWDDERSISISVPAGVMSTWDCSILTSLVVVCHDLGLRLEVRPAGSRHISLTFYQRTHRSGSIMERMPTMEEHVDIIRRGYTVESPSDARTPAQGGTTR